MSRCRWRSEARAAAARPRIELLGAALESSRLANGRYPTTAQGLVTLRTSPTIQPVPNNWQGPYLRKEVPLDPWGNPYLFISPGTVNPVVLAYAPETISRITFAIRCLSGK